MKIIYIIDSLCRHGAQRYLLYLVRGLRPLGYQQLVISLNKAGDADVEEALCDSGCNVIKIGKAAVAFIVGWLRLIAILRRRNADVVMTILDYSDTLGRPAARLAGCRCIISAIQLRNVTKPFWRRCLDRWTIRWAHHVVFNSQHIVSFALENDGVSAEQIVVIPNAVEDLQARSGNLRAEYRAQFQLGPDVRLIGAVGRLAAQKNYPLLLKAASRLPPLPPWKLVIVGDGRQRELLAALGRQLGLAERLIWLGARADVEGCFAAMDIFAHTSDYEGMPNAVMEAMAMALPVVASEVDGTMELIENGKTGFLVRPGDTAGFTEKLHQLLLDVDGGQAMGRMAHENVLQRYNQDRMVGAFDQLFHACAGETI